MYEELALFIDFENIRYSMLNIQRREPDPQELIAVARRFGTVMVARAYADWTRQPESFKGSLTAAMIDRVDCPAKLRNRIRLNSGQYTNTPSGPLGSPEYAPEGTGSYSRPWPSYVNGNSGPLPAIVAQDIHDQPAPEQPASQQSDFDEHEPITGEVVAKEDEGSPDYPYRESYRQPSYQNQSHVTGPLRQGGTGPLGHTLPSRPQGDGPFGGNGGSSSTVVQSTVDLNMLMDIIETVFDRPNISTFVLMTGDKDFTRISARLKLRLNKTVIIVGIPGTVSRDLVSSGSQFVPLVVHGSSSFSSSSTDAYAIANEETMEMPRARITAAMPAVRYPTPQQQFQPMPDATWLPTMDVLDPDFIQFLDYIDRNWPWRTVSSIAHFMGDPTNPKNRFRGRFNRDSARDLIGNCIQQGIVLLHNDGMGNQELRLNRMHPEVAEVLKNL